MRITFFRNSVKYIQDVVANTYGSVFHVTVRIAELSDSGSFLIWARWARWPGWLGYQGEFCDQFNIYGEIQDASGSPKRAR